MSDNGDEVTLELNACVSAKYRGAWCEGRVKSAQYSVQYKVEFANDPGRHATLDRAQVRNGSKAGVCSAQKSNLIQTDLTIDLG